MRRAQTSSGKLKRKFYYQFLSIAPGGITLSVRVIETAEVMSLKIRLTAYSFRLGRWGVVCRLHPNDPARLLRITP